MQERVSYLEGRALAAQAVSPVGTELLPLAECAGRVLAQEMRAGADVPPFDRSPYDGYALRSADTAAGPDRPVTLRVREELPAGAVPSRPVGAGEAVKILTGAPIPPGADGVVKYEDTRFTADTVTLFHPVRPGENIVRAGEDGARGDLLARKGTAVDAALAGVLAAQGLARIPVYRRPRVGLISTGGELLEPGEPPAPGKIYNAGRFLLAAALERLGCTPVWLGAAADDARAIARLLRAGLPCCDAIVLTGGVSAGDWDLTPAAMTLAGARLLFRRARFKPGMACAYAVLEGALLCGLSGNPAAALTNFYAMAAPALGRLRGLEAFLPEELTLTLTAPFPKPSDMTRLLRGRLALSGGRVELAVPERQGNSALGSFVGCNAIAVVPAGSGPLAAGTGLNGFLLPV